MILTHPDSSAVPGAHFVQAVLAEQIEEGAVRLQEAALVVVDGHLFEDPLVHQGRAFDPVPEPVLDLDLPHQDGLDAPLQCVQDGWNLGEDVHRRGGRGGAEVENVLQRRDHGPRGR